MHTNRLYKRLATTGTFKIQKQPDADHQIHINKIFLTADATGTVAFSDGTDTFTFDVGAGQPLDFCWGLVFKGEADITVTCTGPNASVFVEYTYKK